MAAMLTQMLDDFAARYPDLKVDPTPVDVTEAFRSPETGRIVTPRSIGNLSGDRRVLAYTVYGAPFVPKYLKDEAGQVVREEDGSPRIRPFTLENKVLACLCLRDLRNTSFHEIRDALQGTHKVQGFRRWHVAGLEACLTTALPDFRPAADTAFLFAGRPDTVYPRIALNALWMDQILSKGRQALSTMSRIEADLMAVVFPNDVLAGVPQALQEGGYMWQRNILWQPQTAMFLAAKVAARQSVSACSRRMPAYGI